MKENGFKLAKERSRIYLTQTITDAVYADNVALLANSPAQAESLLHRLEPVGGVIGLHVNADKTEYMCFNHRGDNEISEIMCKLDRYNIQSEIINFLSLNQFIPLFYIFYVSPSLGLRICLLLHKISEKKESSKIDTSWNRNWMSFVKQTGKTNGLVFTL